MAVRTHDIAAPTKLGPYELIAVIGKGGMSEVQLAVERTPNVAGARPVVLKIVPDRLATNRELVELLLAEGRLAGLIKHPNVVDIYDVGESEGRYYLAMEYLPGEPLLAIVQAGVAGKRLDLLSTARIISDTAEALEAAHRLKHEGEYLGLLHHDVSLGNIVVLDDGQVKLVDFGVAKAARLAREDDAIHGKLEYMSPEKLRQGEVDRRSDIWSLGVVAWEALTLTRLFDQAETIRQVLEQPIPPPSTVNPEIPSELDDIVMRALERDPNKRHGTAKGMAFELEDFLRKNGYGGRMNVKIAKYMRETFADRVAARERIVEEIGAGTTPQRTTLETAFPTMAKARASANAILVRSQAMALWSPTELADDAGLVAQPVTKPSAVDRTKLLPLAIAGGVLLVVVVILLVAIGGGGGERDEAKPARAAASAPASVDGEEHAAPAAAADEPAEVAAPPPAEPEEIVLDPVIATPPPKPAEPSKPAAKPTTAEGHYALGMQHYQRKDHQAALAAFTEARRANPSYPPAWYGLGLVHEALGNRGAAKAAYLRYLSLAPRAKNATHVRGRLDKL